VRRIGRRAELARMDEIRLDVHIDAPAERVFDVVADHESFLRTASGIHTRVVRPGVPDRDGLGCLHEVRSGRSVRFREELRENAR
jgi:uncharacterized protein YndB with AHSA1/START domain